ncbi:MAG: ferredoxin family protein [Candidatus Hodarchaeales archaeon]|jgi:ferredoxin like protein
MSVSKRHGKEFEKDLLGVTEYKVDAHENAHITVDYSICKHCPHQGCVIGCPVQCYTLIDDERNITFQYEDCVECGTCFIFCDQGSVKWNNPRGTFGVKYHYG